MPVFVLLLRGVNVGRARRVPMADLRALLGDLGHRRVATLLNSGNAVFHAARGGAAAHGQAIGAAIAERFGFEVPLVVKAAADLDRIVAANPLHFDVEAHARVLVVFANSAAALRELAPIGTLVEAPEAFHVGAHAAYLHCAHGILASRAAAALLGRAGAALTTRNWATVLKLQALAHQAGRAAKA
jgi:uncharacterized protein (DUF1697 family)